MTRKQCGVQGLMLSTALVLSACGGDGSSSGGGNNGGGNNGDNGATPTFAVSGTITGNTGDFTLALNGNEESFSGSAFRFTELLADGATYNVTIETPPEGQSCTVSEGSGTVEADITDVSVTCVELADTPDTTYSIGGTIAGNSGEVTLSLNGVQETFSGANFTFTREVEDGGGYLVEFVSTSDDQLCSVENGAGTAEADVENITVTCSVALSRIEVFDGEIGELESGDFNGDGFVDVIFKLAPNGDHPQGNDGEEYYARAYFGLGTGGFTEPADIELAGGALYSSATRAHFNDDTIDDYVTLTTPTLESYLGEASNSFRSNYRVTREIDNNLSGADQVNAADLNGDGLDDLIVTILGGSIVEFYATYLSNGDGSFADQVINGFRIPGGLVDDILDTHVADFNGDGLADAFALVQTDGELVLYLASGNGDGTFTEPTATQTLPEDLYFGVLANNYHANEMAVADIDGDEDLDIALYSTTDYMLVLKNNGLGSFEVFQQVTVGAQPLYAGFADMNNDAIMDLVALTGGPRQAVIAFGQSDGSFGALGGTATEVVTFDLEEAGDRDDVAQVFRGLELVDVDLDGSLDIVLTEAGSTRTSPSGLYGAIGSLRILNAPGF